jgi:anti-sigma regulatory factor (Ser/Thr protein kinase)
VKGAAGRGRRRRAPLVLSLPSRTEFLGLLRDLARRLALDAGFDEATAGGLALAVDEAATNVIEHAYQGRGDGLLELRFDHLGKDFRVELVDSGATIDPRTVPRVDLERYAREGRKGGLGVHLMERIMDSVTFSRSARRNVCCLVKRRP